MLRWMFTSENWFARWWRGDRCSCGCNWPQPLNSKIPRKIQERINRAHFDAAVYGIDPVPEYEAIYEMLKEVSNRGS